MKSKILKISLVGLTNAGKSTLVNCIVGETVSITNKKINTTQELILGITNINNNQLIFYDTPGLNFIKSKIKTEKKLKINLWQGIDTSDLIIYLIDSKKINLKSVYDNIKILTQTKIKIIIVFNKIDLIDKNKLLPIIKKISEFYEINSFFTISAKYNIGVKNLLNNLIKLSKHDKWLYLKDEISDKDEGFISIECTRNAILTYLHDELPYNVKIINKTFKYLNKNELKIKQQIIIDNKRYKKIILGKKGIKIKTIREFSQKQISNILKYKTHLYIEVVTDNAN